MNVEEAKEERAIQTRLSRVCHELNEFCQGNIATKRFKFRWDIGNNGKTSGIPIVYGNIYAKCDEGNEGIWNTKFIADDRYYHEWNALKGRVVLDVKNEYFHEHLKSLDTIKEVNVNVDIAKKEADHILSLFGGVSDNVKTYSLEEKVDLILERCSKCFDSFEELYSTANANIDEVLANQKLMTQRVIMDLGYLTTASDWKDLKRMLRDLPNLTEDVCEYVAKPDGNLRVERGSRAGRI